MVLTLAKMMVGLILLAGSTVALAQDASTAFFRPEPDKIADFHPEKVYPQGRVFPFGYFSTGGGSVNHRGDLLPSERVDAVMKQVKDDGATLIGPQYELNDRILADAKKFGLKAVYTIGLHVKKENLPTSDQEIVATVKQQVEAVMGDSNIAWWYVIPEEIRYWNKTDWNYFTLAVKTIHETDPKGRPVLLYEPNHRNAAALSKTAEHLDILGKGMYANYAKFMDNRVWCRWSVEQQAEGIRLANRPNDIHIALPEMFQEPPVDKVALIPTWVRHDVYVALVTGAQGVLVFSLSERPNFPSHDAYYQAYATVAKELTGPMNLGQVFLFGERRDDLKMQVTSGPAKIPLTFPVGGVKEPIELDSVAMANIEFDGKRYLTLVNSANEAVRVTVSGIPTTGVKVVGILDQASCAAPAGAIQLTLEPLHVKVLRIEKAQ